MEYDIDGGSTHRKSETGSDQRIFVWEKTQELRSELSGEYNFLLEVAGVTPDAPVHTDWFVA
jgi:hypothetical protein